MHARDEPEEAVLPSQEVTWLAGLRRPPRDAPEAELARNRLAATMFPDDREPARVGRYVLLHRIGSGGMGVVYAAFDPELDRKLAIKILHAFDRSAQEGLLQEARALARLSHPHVVAVHDVGTFALPGPGDTPQLMFLAMEFVEGRTLSAWLAEQPRSPRAVLDLLREAGEGLAAAHAVGVVHRDFKPDNVLVDRDGHARVVDFGLARAHDRMSGNSWDESAEDSRTREVDTPVYGGTPAYMSPEQVAGVTTDARTDQFSFGVTLWEALYGERPFVGKSLTELATNILEGKRRAPARAIRVPRWLRAAMHRALAVDPADRWPSLDALLHALARGRARARLYGALAGAGVLAMLSAGVLGVQHIDEERRLASCEEQGTAIAEVWNDDARQAVRAGLLASGASNAATTADKLMPWLDEHAQAWTRSRTEVCTNAEVWNADTVERATWCLDDRRRELHALVDELRDADVETVRRSVQAAARLRDVAPCIDTELLQRQPAPPVEGREEIESIDGELARVEAMRETGEYANALLIAQAALQRAEALGWVPLTARTRTLAGQLHGNLGHYDEAVQLLESAFFEASMQGVADVAYSAALSIAKITGVELVRLRDAELWLKLAEVQRGGLADPSGLHEVESLRTRSALRRAAGHSDDAAKISTRVLEIVEATLGSEHPDVATALNDLAVAHASSGAPELGVEFCERALRIREHTLGPDHPDVGSSLGNLAAMNIELGQYPRATELLERGIPILERTLGPEHREVAGNLNNLATARAELGSHAEAIALHERALRIWEQTLGPDHPDLAFSLGNLGNLYETMGAFREAAALQERALAITEKALGPEHPELAEEINNLANVRFHMGDYDASAELHARALAITEKAFGPEHHAVARSLANLGNVRYAQRRIDEAWELHERALAVEERVSGPEHPNVAGALLGLARDALARDRASDAVTLAERALALLEASEFPPYEIAEAQFVLARALGQQDERALALARSARDAYTERGAAQSDVLATVDAWLREATPR